MQTIIKPTLGLRIAWDGHPYWHGTIVALGSRSGHFAVQYDNGEYKACQPEQFLEFVPLADWE